MKKLTYVLALGLALSSLALARPVFELVMEADLETAIEQLSEALTPQGFEIVRQLDIGESIRGRGTEAGANFMPMKILILSTDESMLSAVDEDPRLAVFLPLSLAIYEAETGQTSLAVVDHSRLMSFFNLSSEKEAALNESFEKIYSAMSELGKVRRAPGGLTTIPPYAVAPVGEASVEDAMFLFSSSYQSQNMNQVGDMGLGDVMHEWFCNTGYAEAIFSIEPALATGAPCRIFSYEQDGQVYIGAANSEYARAAFPKTNFTEEARVAFDAISELNRSVFVEMGTEFPY
ncbi:MAG: DUF302 domain-containing protein [Deinococcales bacterium]